VTRSWVGIGAAVALAGLAVASAGRLARGDGPAPRAARSVHLGYDAADVAVFHIELTVLASTPGSFFMAAGWNTGYFGLQELRDGRKAIIFSVWDPTRGDDPEAVANEDRVECLHHADGMRIRRFGGEGTGGQCLGDFAWMPGERHRFAVTASVAGRTTAYAGHVWNADAGRWRHLVTFRTRTGGRLPGGLYSFIEDFRRDGRSAGEVRRARFGAAWAQGGDGAWHPLRTARFTASGAEWEARETIDAGVEAGDFMLATGGDVRPTRPLGARVELPPEAAAAPPDVPRTVRPAD